LPDAKVSATPSSNSAAPKLLALVAHNDVSKLICQGPPWRSPMFDMKNLRRLKNLDKYTPEASNAFGAFEKAAFAEGVLTVQQKQLMAVAVALTTQCPYCIEIHNQAARNAGATDAQLAEAAVVAIVMRAGAAMTHASHLFAD
jgi:AhpD family alkylhydroperoxidase